MTDVAWLCFRGSARRHHGFLSLASQWPPGSRPPGRVGARDQTRRLPPRRAPGRPQGAPVLPPRHEWSDRFHRISEALASLRTRSVRIDGEAVVLCPKPGLWLFDQLHSCRRDRDVNLYVFDLLEFNGRVSDRFRLRSARRGSRVSSRLRQGIKLSEHIDAVFRHACKPRAHRLQAARLVEI